MAKVVHAFIGLGANLGDPCKQLIGALHALRLLPRTRLVAASRLYRTEPLEVDGPQPLYLNAAALLETELEPLALLAELQEIERAYARTRHAWHAPRTLDLDLLLYGAEQINLPQLTVPHPRLVARAFALFPLLELVPECTHPALGRLADYLPPLLESQCIEPISEQLFSADDTICNPPAMRILE